MNSEDVCALTLARATDIVSSNYAKRHAEKEAHKAQIDRLEAIGEIYLSEARWFRDLAYFDQMTGLPNRTFFAIEVEQKIDKDNEFIVLVMDLDNFKQINSELWHDGGDLAIIHFWKILQKVIDTYNNSSLNEAIPTRLGGDEFAVALRGNADIGRSIASDIQKALHENPMILSNGKPYQFTVTIGMANNHHVREFPVSLQQKEAWVKIPMWFAQAMKLADIAVETTETGSIKLCDGIPDTHAIDERYKDCSKNIKDLLRWMNTNDDFVPVCSKLVEQLAIVQNIEWHIRMIDETLAYIEKQYEVNQTTHHTMIEIMSEVERFRKFLRAIDFSPISLV